MGPGFFFQIFVSRMYLIHMSRRKERESKHSERALYCYLLDALLHYLISPTIGLPAKFVDLPIEESISIYSAQRTGDSNRRTGLQNQCEKEGDGVCV